MLACVYMYLYVKVTHVWLCMEMCMEVIIEVVIVFLFVLYFGGRGQNPSLNLELSLTLTNLAIQLVLGIPILSLLSARIAGTATPVWLLCGFWIFKLWSLCFHGKHFTH